MKEFNELLELMREEGKAYNPMMPSLGTVVSSLPSIQVRMSSGMILETDDLLIDRWIYERYNFEIYNTCGEHGIETVTTNPSLKRNLKVGAKVLLVPINDGEKFLITSEVMEL